MQIDNIDFVVAWVDGNDPTLNQRRLKYWQEHNNSAYQAKPNPPGTHYGNNNEIIFCLASILRNAPFARRIHVITDQQRPPLQDLRDFGFSQAELAKISIVDHQDIFRELDDLAPTFNSLSIESLIHRAPGLADHFVYMNDDFFIMKPTSPSDYFAAPETPVISGNIRPYCPIYYRCKLWLLDLWSLRQKTRWSFVNGCMGAGLAAKMVFRYILLDHSPRPMYRPVLHDFFESYPQILRENAKFRFRHRRQFLPSALASCLSLRQGKLKIRPRDLTVGYLKPGATSKHRHSAILPKDVHFLCVQNLDQATEVERAHLLDRLRWALTTPHPKDPIHVSRERPE